MKRFLHRVPRFLLAFVGIFLLGDFGYSIYVARKLKAWEASVERNEDGVLVGCEDYSKGSGEVALLLVHGINDTPYCWRKMAPELAKSFHLRAMRMPGFGEPIAEYAKYNADDWIASIRDEAKQLRETHQRVFVVAHSLGGAVLIQTLLREGDKQGQLADGVVLLAPAIEVSNQRSPIFPTRFWHRFGGLLVFTQTTYNPFGNDAQDPNEQEAPNRVRFSPRNVVNETFRLIDANRNRESEISIPVLMVLSNKDNVNDFEASEAWMDKLATSRKEIFWNNRSGHSLQYDLGWESVANAIKEFVETSDLKDAR